MSSSSVKRIKREPPVEGVGGVLQQERAKRIGRPSKVEEFRARIVELCSEKDSEGNALLSKEIHRRVCAEGFKGKKSAAYALIASVRPEPVRPLVRFEGIAGEFCQHDFGEVDVKLADGVIKRIKFFASRLKYSRYARVTIVDDERTETLVRCVVQHYDDMGGVPLLGVFDRPRTIAHAWLPDGTVTKWNTTFVGVMVDLGVGVEVCFPRRGNQKGSVENLVGWVKGSFFKQRSFLDEHDLREQLAAWHVEVNTKEPSRATGVIPETRRLEELPRLRPLKVKPHELALRFPVVVGPTAFVLFETHEYMLPAGAIGIGGTLFLYRDRVRIVIGRHDVVYERPQPGSTKQRLSHPYMKAEMVAAVSGRRGRLYLMREQIVEVGQPALDFMTELVHRRPRTWPTEIERLHALVLKYDKASCFAVFKRAVDEGTVGVEYVAHHLRSVGRLAAQAESGRSDIQQNVAPDSAPAVAAVIVKASRPTGGA